MKMKLGSLDVYEGDEECGHGYFCAFEHAGYELCKFDVFWTPDLFPRGWRTTKSIIDGVYDDIHCISCQEGLGTLAGDWTLGTGQTYYLSWDLDIDELEDCRWVGWGVDKTELVAGGRRRWGRRRGHCKCWRALGLWMKVDGWRGYLKESGGPSSRAVSVIEIEIWLTLETELAHSACIALAHLPLTRFLSSRQLRILQRRVRLPLTRLRHLLHSLLSSESPYYCIPLMLLSAIVPCCPQNRHHRRIDWSSS